MIRYQHAKSAASLISCGQTAWIAVSVQVAYVKCCTTVGAGIWVCVGFVTPIKSEVVKLSTLIAELALQIHIFKRTDVILAIS